MKLVVKEIQVPNTVKLALNMIVKNEGKIIERLLTSVLPIVDTYCICDTGSTDNTKEIIKNFFDKWDISGSIVDEQFIDFGYNRNFALQKCRETVDCDYILFLDADMQLKIGKGFDKNILNGVDYCHILQGNDNFTYQNVRIIKNKPGFEYKGSTHEYIHIPDKSNSYTFKKNVLFINDVGDGGSKDNKFTRDIKLLLNEIQEKPGDPRAHFYLANSYFDSKQYSEAINMYKKRIELNGWEEEIFYSYYRIGKSYECLKDIPKAIYYYLEAYDSHPGRVEPIYSLIKLYRIKNKPELANLFFKQAINIDHPPACALFVESDVYAYKLFYEFYIFYYYLNNNDKAVYDENIIHKVFLNLLNFECHSTNILKNYNFYSESLDFRNNDNVTSCIRLKNIDEKFVKTDIIDKTYFNSSTPSITLFKNKTIINIRYVNYYIDLKWNYKYKENQEKTKNIFIEFSDDSFINPIACKCIQEPILTKTDMEIIGNSKIIEGVQDIRLLEFNNTLYYTGVVLHEKDGKRRGNIHYGIYDVSNVKLDGCLIKSPNNRTCEKNWILFHNTKQLLVIYEWYPLTIGEIKNNTLEIKTTYEMPKMFKQISGSSNGVIVDNEIWFVCHFISYQNPRHYYHIIIKLDLYTLKFSGNSRPFRFEGQPIEYCCGLRLHRNLLYMTYSVKDNSSNIAVIQKEKITFIEKDLSFK